MIKTKKNIINKNTKNTKNKISKRKCKTLKNRLGNKNKSKIQRGGAGAMFLSSALSSTPEEEAKKKKDELRRKEAKEAKKAENKKEADRKKAEKAEKAAQTQPGPIAKFFSRFSTPKKSPQVAEPEQQIPIQNEAGINNTELLRRRIEAQQKIKAAKQLQNLKANSEVLEKKRLAFKENKKPTVAAPAPGEAEEEFNEFSKNLELAVKERNSPYLEGLAPNSPINTTQPYTIPNVNNAEQINATLLESKEPAPATTVAPAIPAVAQELINNNSSVGSLTNLNSLSISNLNGSNISRMDNINQLLNRNGKPILNKNVITKSNIPDSIINLSNVPRAGNIKGPSSTTLSSVSSNLESNNLPSANRNLPPPTTATTAAPTAVPVPVAAPATAAVATTANTDISEYINPINFKQNIILTNEENKQIEKILNDPVETLKRINNLINMYFPNAKDSIKKMNFQAFYKYMSPSFALFDKQLFLKIKEKYNIKNNNNSKFENITRQIQNKIDEKERNAKANSQLTESEILLKQQSVNTKNTLKQPGFFKRLGATVAKTFTKKTPSAYSEVESSPLEINDEIKIKKNDDLFIKNQDNKFNKITNKVILNNFKYTNNYNIKEIEGEYLKITDTIWVKKNNITRTISTNNSGTRTISTNNSVVNPLFIARTDTEERKAIEKEAERQNNAIANAAEYPSEIINPQDLSLSTENLKAAEPTVAEPLTSRHVISKSLKPEMSNRPKENTERRRMGAAEPKKRGNEAQKKRERNASAAAASRIPFATPLTQSRVLPKDIKHFWYRMWPDHGVPLFNYLNKEDDFVKFIDILYNDIKSDPGGTVIHCSAGVGRTGTIFVILKICLDNSKTLSQLLAEINSGKTKILKHNIDTIINYARTRRTLLVQTAGQYIFLLKLFKVKKDDDKSYEGLFNNYHEEFTKYEKSLGLTKIYAIEPCNRNKNRYNNILPYDDTRVVLSNLNLIECGDYINASYLYDVGDAKNNFGGVVIAAQGPTPNTKDDFLRMLADERLQIKRIIMLTNLNEGGFIKCDDYTADKTLENPKITEKLPTGNNNIFTLSKIGDKYELNYKKIYENTLPIGKGVRFGSNAKMYNDPSNPFRTEPAVAATVAATPLQVSKPKPKSKYCYV